ncbi:DUF2188 domain-containing protein [Niabella insulamsoli]|uniref:DUF2188 domain-containing protein n=1 Tax=Niabella insulamsoli TaxID=3144874 RepID=UPI0031FC14A6
MAKTVSIYTEKLGKTVAQQAKGSIGKYHVIPVKTDAWAVVEDGSLNSFKKFSTKHAAVSFAKKYASNAATGEVVVHGVDGKVLSRISY